MRITTPINSALVLAAAIAFATGGTPGSAMATPIGIDLTPDAQAALAEYGITDTSELYDCATHSDIGVGGKYGGHEPITISLVQLDRNGVRKPAEWAQYSINAGPTQEGASITMSTPGSFIIATAGSTAATDYRVIISEASQRWTLDLAPFGESTCPKK